MYAIVLYTQVEVLDGSFLPALNDMSGEKTIVFAVFLKFHTYINTGEQTY
jgi:hypothetical protein